MPNSETTELQKLLFAEADALLAHTQQCARCSAFINQAKVSLGNLRPTKGQALLQSPAATAARRCKTMRKLVSRVEQAEAAAIRDLMARDGIPKSAIRNSQSEI